MGKYFKLLLFKIIVKNIYINNMILIKNKII